MANSLRAKLSKLRHDRNITDAEYQELIKKLDGHDREIRNKVISEFTERLKENSIRGAFEYKPNKKEPWHKVRAFCRVVGARKIDEIAEEMRGGGNDVETN